MGAASTSSPSRSTATSWQISKTSSRWCEMYRTATPAAVSCRTRSNSRWLAWRSSAAVGSSSSTHLAPRASARAISTTWSCSTDSSRQGVSGAMSSPHSPMMSRVLRRIARQLTTRGPTADGPTPTAGRRGRRSPRPTGAARSSSAGTPWRSTRASARCRRRAARARRRTAPCPRPARTGRTGSRRGSTCPRRSCRPGRGTARRRWKGQLRAGRGWCRTASRHRSLRRVPLPGKTRHPRATGWRKSWRWLLQVTGWPAPAQGAGHRAG